MTSFKPASYFSNRHLQTLWHYLFPRKYNLRITTERLEIPDGDFIDLNWAGNDKQTIVIITHGLMGNINSHYMQNLMHHLTLSGLTAVCMHFRGASHEINRKPHTYHAGEINDLDYVINTIKQRYPNSKLVLAGFSLGANVILNYLAADKKALICAAVAVSPPFELRKSTLRLQSGISRLYQWVLLRQMKQMIRQKESQLEKLINVKKALASTTIYDFDNHVTAPLFNFDNVEHYYQQCSSRYKLQDINTHTLIIHAKDDPFMTEDMIPSNSEVSRNVNLLITEKGGHVGFIADRYPRQNVDWLSKTMLSFIQKSTT